VIDWFGGFRIGDTGRYIGNDLTAVIGNDLDADFVALLDRGVNSALNDRIGFFED
jgi:hypothetical protein